MKKLRAKADKLWQIKCVGENPKCEGCGKIAYCCHHFIPKSIASALRYYLPNGVKICKECHFKIHNGDMVIVAKILEKRGKKWLEDLKEKRKQQIRVNKKYFEDIIQQLNG